MCLKLRPYGQRSIEGIMFTIEVPHVNFKELLQELGNQADFAKRTTGRTDSAKKRFSPLSLLLLGALRYLVGRAGCFDDCQHRTNIHKEMHHHFFHLFLKHASSVLFWRYVVVHTISDEAKTHVHKIQMTGFLGCVSCTYATNITMYWCPNKC